MRGGLWPAVQNDASEKAQAKARAGAGADRIVSELTAEFERRDGMTVYQLAQEVGGSQVNVQAVLDGREKPGLSRVLAIAAALGKTLVVADRQQKKGKAGLDCRQLRGS